MKINMENFIKNTKIFFKNFLIIFKNPKFSISIFISQILCFASACVGVGIVDNAYVDEISTRILINAEKSEHGFSYNFVHMKERGNSDFFIYSNNNLQNFQMRNQQNNNPKNYTFISYSPYSSYTPVQVEAADKSKINCTTLLYKSKYDGTNFYFDLPLLSGAFARHVTKNTVVLLDKVADKILSNGENYDSLIGKSIPSKSIQPNGSSLEDLKIEAIVASDQNELGRFITNVFGDNIVFTTEYNSYKMNGQCNFVINKKTNENKDVVNFMFDNYKSSNSSASNLEIGYTAEYNFYEWNNSTKKYEAGIQNTEINKILEFNNSSTSMIIAILALILALITLTAQLLIIAKSKKMLYSVGFSQSILFVWCLFCISMLVNSVLFKYNFIMNLIFKVKFISYSETTTTVLFILWLSLALLSVICLAPKQKKAIKQE